MSGTGSGPSSLSSRARWLLPLVVIGIGGTMLSMNMRENGQPDPCEGIGLFDQDSGACTLHIVVPDTKSLTAECESGRLGFRFARLEAQRYACPRGFEMERAGRVVHCGLDLRFGVETDCEGLSTGVLRHTPALRAD